VLRFENKKEIPLALMSISNQRMQINALEETSQNILTYQTFLCTIIIVHRKVYALHTFLWSVKVKAGRGNESSLVR
jgi:hypothetical protein